MMPLKRKLQNSQMPLPVICIYNKLPHPLPQSRKVKYLLTCELQQTCSTLLIIPKEYALSPYLILIAPPKLEMPLMSLLVSNCLRLMPHRAVHLSKTISDAAPESCAMEPRRYRGFAAFPFVRLPVSLHTSLWLPTHAPK